MTNECIGTKHLCRTAADCMPTFTQCVAREIVLGAAPETVVWGVCQ
jgi:hypothetical protein